MGIQDRGYMRRRDDERQIADYEQAEQEREYGPLAGRRRTSGRTVAILIALAMLAAVALAIFY